MIQPENRVAKLKNKQINCHSKRWNGFVVVETFLFPIRISWQKQETPTEGKNLHYRIMIITGWFRFQYFGSAFKVHVSTPSENFLYLIQFSVTLICFFGFKGAWSKHFRVLDSRGFENLDYVKFCVWVVGIDFSDVS